jgi:hypothetical protein
MKTGDRVALCGSVSYERGGFVLVRWDDGTSSLVWGVDLTVMPSPPPPPNQPDGAPASPVRHIEARS